MCVQKKGLTDQLNYLHLTPSITTLTPSRFLSFFIVENSVFHFNNLTMEFTIKLGLVYGTICYSI